MSEPVSEFPTLRDRISSVCEQALNYSPDQGTPLEWWTKMVDDLLATVTAGADFTTEHVPGAERTPAQVLACLLDAPEAERLQRLTLLQEATWKAQRCWEMDHDGQREQLQAVTAQASAYRAALQEAAQVNTQSDVQKILTRALAK